jgi:tetratricopeptide (TPR) repeat protein
LLRFDDQKDLTIVADRFMYLPSAGICVFLGWGIEYLLALAGKYDRKIRLLILTGLVAVIFILAVLTSCRVRLWGNEYLLWEQVAKRYQSAVAYSQLGNYFLKKDDFTKALENYQKAIAISPSYGKPYSNIGMIMVKKGDYAQAVDYFTRTIQMDPKKSGITFTNRGYAYMRLGREADALADYDHAIAVDQRYLPAYLNRATLYKNRNDFTRAMADLDQVLSIDPGNKTAQNNRQILRKMINDENSR